METGDSIKLGFLRGLAFVLRLPFVKGRVRIFEFFYGLLNPKNKIVERQVNNLPVVIDLTQTEARYLYYGAYELHELRFIRNHVARGSTVVDVGANVGYLTAVFAGAVGSGGKVCAFEPNPVVFPHLERLAANSKGVVDAFQMAVADQNAGSTIRFYVSHDHPMWSSMIYGYSESQAIEVETVSLSDFISKKNLAVDFIKIDVEGGEAAVLRGLSEYLSGGERPSILCEVAADANGVNAEALQELDNLINQFGYQIFTFDKKGNVGMTSFEEVRGRKRTFNVVLLPDPAEMNTRVQHTS